MFKGGEVVLEGLALCIYLKDSMPPKKIDVPAKGVDSAIWLRHRHYCLALSVLECSISEGERLVLFVLVSSEWQTEDRAVPFTTKGHRYSEVLCSCLVRLQYSKNN